MSQSRGWGCGYNSKGYIDVNCCFHYGDCSQLWCMTMEFITRWWRLTFCTPPLSAVLQLNPRVTYLNGWNKASLGFQPLCWGIEHTMSPQPICPLKQALTSLMSHVSFYLMLKLGTYLLRGGSLFCFHYNWKAQPPETKPLF